MAERLCIERAYLQKRATGRLKGISARSIIKGLCCNKLRIEVGVNALVQVCIVSKGHTV